MKGKLILLVLQFSCFLYGFPEEEGGPMNAEWFYNPKNPFSLANDFYQKREWKTAVLCYRDALAQGCSSAYDRQMARLNLASCLMAQNQASEHWAAFDFLVGIPEKKRISSATIAHAVPGKSILIRTDKVGIGDIVHFLEAAFKLRDRTDWDVTLSLRDFLIGTLSSAVAVGGLKIVGEKEVQPETDYETHLIGLFGHLEMQPTALIPESVRLTAPEEAMKKIAQRLRPILRKFREVAVVFRGEENRLATLMGGKRLPRDPNCHGRYLFQEPFEALLNEHESLSLIDGGGNIFIEGPQRKRCITLPPKKESFDMIVALAHFMNCNRRMVGFGSDNGPTNVFARALTSEAQGRMAYIIPNGNEYDMRMEGEGEKYIQMISRCLVYKCHRPQDQTRVIGQAYNDMTSITS